MLTHGLAGRIVLHLRRQTGRRQAGRILRRIAKVAVHFILAWVGGTTSASAEVAGFALLLGRVQVDLLAVFGQRLAVGVVRIEYLVVVLELREKLQPADVVLLVGETDLIIENNWW